MALKPVGDAALFDQVEQALTKYAPSLRMTSGDVRKQSDAMADRGYWLDMPDVQVGNERVAERIRWRAELTVTLATATGGEMAASRAESAGLEHQIIRTLLSRAVMTPFEIHPGPRQRVATPNNAYWIATLRFTVSWTETLEEFV